MLALIDADIITYRIGFASEDVNEKLCLARCAEFMEELVMKPWVANTRVISLDPPIIGKTLQ